MAILAPLIWYQETLPLPLQLRHMPIFVFQNLFLLVLLSISTLCGPRLFGCAPKPVLASVLRGPENSAPAKQYWYNVGSEIRAMLLSIRSLHGSQLIDGSVSVSVEWVTKSVRPGSFHPKDHGFVSPAHYRLYNSQSTRSRQSQQIVLQLAAGGGWCHSTKQTPSLGYWYHLYSVMMSREITATKTLGPELSLSQCA